ncbi:MAG: hypothetical protein MZV70_45975 [Desulfobacterales bacterium]|nr:hypothetical protein [Desulfobacterales bacterium]
MSRRRFTRLSSTFIEVVLHRPGGPDDDRGFAGGLVGEFDPVDGRRRPGRRR